MAKRFTDTDKWKDEWYTELSNDYKVIWQYLLDTCDNAGIYKRNIKLLNYYCNTNVSDTDILNVFKLRVAPISDEKWIINKSILYQYPIYTLSIPYGYPQGTRTGTGTS